MKKNDRQIHIIPTERLSSLIEHNLTSSVNDRDIPDSYFRIRFEEKRSEVVPTEAMPLFAVFGA